MTCHCGRGEADSGDGICSSCRHDAAAAFWGLFDGKLSLGEFTAVLALTSRPRIKEKKKGKNVRSGK